MEEMVEMEDRVITLLKKSKDRLREENFTIEKILFELTESMNLKSQLEADIEKLERLKRSLVKEPGPMPGFDLSEYFPDVHLINYSKAEREFEEGNYVIETL